MQVDVLVIGQGISGTWLTYFLHQNGLRFHVIDNSLTDTSSRIASGLINPITGRRLVKTWLIETLMEFCTAAYPEFGKKINASLMHPTTLVNFPASLQMKQAFDNRRGQEQYLQSVGAGGTAMDNLFHSNFGCFVITPCLLLDIHKLLDGWRHKLKVDGNYSQQLFEIRELTLKDGGVQYQSITAQQIVFCDGTASFSNPWFHRLPFAPSKGEALWIHAPDLPRDRIYKQGYTLVPWEEGLFWVGSSYEWEFQEAGPTTAFRNNCERQLKQWLKVPFTVVDHKAAVRPATLERRPFIGMHPLHRSIGIMNGMGSKGCSLAPYFAQQLAGHLKTGAAIMPEADVGRHARLLSKS